MYSLFEPHTEWLYKGKVNKRVELGHNMLVASDPWGFVVEHQVIEREADVSLSLPLADRLLSLYIPAVIMPKKGKKNPAEQAEESGRIFRKLRHRHSAVESDSIVWNITAWTGVWTKGCTHLRGIVPWE